MSILISPEVVLDWTPQLFKAALRKDPKPTDKPKFSVTSLYTHESLLTPEFKTIMDAVIAAAVARFGETKFKLYVAEDKFESPFKKDIGSKGYDLERFKFRVASSSGEAHPPTVRGPDRSIVTDPREVYPGCIARVSYSARAYGGLDTGWTPGVALDLRNVWKVADGDRLATGGTGGTEFGAPPPATQGSAADMAALLA